MARIDVYNVDAEKISQRDIRDDIFTVPIREDILHEVVLSQLAHRRSGSASTRNRSEIRASSRKLWRQKGTGRARVGAASSPLWRGGGVTFGPTPRDYSLKVNRKVRKAALRMALADKFKTGQVIVVDAFQLEEIKTKRVSEIFQNFEADSVLIVSEQPDEILEKSSRNIPNIKLLRAEGLNVYDILHYKYLLFVEPALGIVEGDLAQ